ISYTVYPDGKIQVRPSYKGVKGLPDMPIFAVYFKISADYQQLDWYAKGPWENYVDRENGARLLRFSNTAANNVEPYSIVQDTGNFLGVCRLNIKDKEDNGIM